jgi:hypothetical protein
VVAARGVLDGDGGIECRLADDKSNTEGRQAGNQAGEQTTNQEVSGGQRSVTGKAEQVAPVV